MVRPVCSGFPMLGELGDPGVYPPSSGRSGYITRDELFKEASSRFIDAKRGDGLNAKELWVDAISQKSENWFDGPFRYAPAGGL